MSVKEARRQSGFIILMGMLLLVLGAGVWFGTLGNLKSNTLKIQHNIKFHEQLKLIKQRMINYAVLHPEIYSDATAEPGPGYFPCPDLNGDGSAASSCGSPGSEDQLFVYGMVPYRIGGRDFTFIDSDLDNRMFWYAVDARFVNNSQVYTSYLNNRFAELNTNLSNEVVDKDSNLTSPFTLDGRDEIVMVLFYAGEAIGNQVRPLTPSYTDYDEFLEQVAITDGLTVEFKSVDVANDFNDYVIAITRAEWEAAMLSRVSHDADEDGSADFCSALVSTDVHWFNECVYNSPSNAPGFSCTYDAAAANDNIAGQNWRGIVCP